MNRAPINLDTYVILYRFSDADEWMLYGAAVYDTREIAENNARCFDHSKARSETRFAIGVISLFADSEIN